MADPERLNIQGSEPHIDIFPSPERRRPPIAFLFEGQGSQFVGMGKEFVGVPKVDSMYADAKRIFHYSVRNLSINGPKEAIDQTICAQPAIVAYNIACQILLRD